MTTGGTETFAYDTWHRRQYYSDPYHSNPGNPSIQYSYDALDRVSGVTDALSQSTGFSYNDRGQLTMTTLPSDPVDGIRHTIINTYNNTGNNAGNGTLISVTDQLGHMTSYTYDDYRRVKSVTIPRQQQQTNGVSYTTNYYYDANGVGDDYTLTNSDVTWVVLPSGKKTHLLYDDNRRKQSVTVGSGTGDQATTSYAYDNVGNLTVLKLPLQQSGQQWNGKSTVTDYDERNRPWRITDALNNATIINYDQFGRKNKITRPNNQVITYDAFDQMNRVTQSTATAVGTTKYTYYSGSGLLHTMMDPRLVANNSTDNYSYTYDVMGRKTSVTYPADSGGFHRSESFWYDAAGRLWLFTNRSALTQTFTYDGLNRMTGFSWSDRGTPSVTFGYDAASRLTNITNIDAVNNTTIATINRSYFDDNLLNSETEDLTAIGGTSKKITYNYDSDGNRSTLTYPGNSWAFTYGYTNRNQLTSIASGNPATVGYLYNLNGDMTSVWRNAPTTTSSYTHDALDRVTHIEHTLFRDARTFDYDYDSVGNRKWMKREDRSGDVYGYDLKDQVIGCWLDIMDPDIQAPPDQTIYYDGAGNLIGFSPYQWQQSYTTNNLNQYTQRYTVGQGTSRATPTPRPRGTPVPRPTPTGQQAATYDNTGNISIGFDGSTYVHDAQNRLTWDATPNSGTMLFEYDGLNRQVSRRIGTNGARTFSVWDGWDLIEEYQSGNNVTARYLYGPNGLVKNLLNGNSYFQDGSGSTSYVTDNTGQLLEFYLYDLQGTPTFYDANGNPLNPNQTAIGVRHLFTGQQWYQELGLYDLRNRFYSPDIGRFLQPDAIGFNGDATNLYRYCGNNPVSGGADPLGMYAVPHSGGWYTYIVNPGWGQYVWAQTYVPGSNQWCAAGAQILSGGWINGTYHDMPNTGYWFQGASLTSATLRGTVVAEGWQDGGYPSLSPRDYRTTYGSDTTVNHTGIFLGFDDDGNALILDQYEGKPLGITKVSPDDQWQWNEVDVAKGDPRYNPESSGGAGGLGGGSGSFNTRTPSIIGGIYYPFGFGNRSPNLNFGEGTAGTMQGAFSWSMNDAFLTGVLNWGDVGRDMYANPIGAMEPGIGPGCFVADTPVLLADGSEKPIENVQVGEAVLAWNEETKTVFSTTVVRTLRHEEKPQTLFDIELEDGRTLAVNNHHPMYVVEDGDFAFSGELAARFAKGEPITFQDDKNQLVKISSVRMRRGICKVYNLEVEGQGQNGHTYYAGGVLVHNSRAGNEWK
jgi:RHS repeat-associated protein